MRKRWRRWWWVGLIGLGLGFGIGLAASWTIWPRRPRMVGLAQVKALYQDDYIDMVALAYGQDGDLALAQQRLSLLHPVDVSTRVAALTEHKVAEGAPLPLRRGLARLAFDLGARDGVVMAYVATPARSPTARPTDTLTPWPSATTFTPTVTRTAQATRTALQLTVRTPEPTKYPACVLVSQALLEGEDNLMPGQVIILVRDAAGRGVPGVWIQTSWAGGQDTFVTGLHPDTSPGYADFALTPGIEYVVSLAASPAQAVEGIVIPAEGTDEQIPPSWRVEYMCRDKQGIESARE